MIWKLFTCLNNVWSFALFLILIYFRLRHESCIDMEDVDYDSRSALHQAACSNRIQAVDFIVKHHLCFPEATDR